MKNWRIPAVLVSVGLVLVAAPPANAAQSLNFGNSLCAAKAEFTGAFAKTSRVSGTCLKLGVQALLQNVYGGSPYWSEFKESVSGATSITLNGNSATEVVASLHTARNGALAQGLPD